MSGRPQSHHLVWPLTPAQVEALDDMLGLLFRQSRGTGGAALPDPVTVEHGGTGLVTIPNHELIVGRGTSAPSPITNGTTGQVLTAVTGADPAFQTLTLPADKTGITVDAGTKNITTGIKGYIRAPRTGTITRWTIMALQSGDITFNIFKDPYASFPSTTSIVAAAPPTMSASTHATSSTLTGWTTAVTAGDVFGFYVTSVSGIQKVTLELEIQ